MNFALIKLSMETNNYKKFLLKFIEENNLPLNEETIFHLITPKETNAFLNFKENESSYSWRNETIVKTGDFSQDLINLVTPQLEPIEEVFDLNEPVVNLLKFQKSGSRNTLVGSDFIFGGPSFTGDANVSEKTLRKVFLKWFNEGLILKSVRDEKGNFLKIETVSNKVHIKENVTLFTFSKMDSLEIENVIFNEINLKPTNVIYINSEEGFDNFEYIYEINDNYLTIPVSSGSSLILGVTKTVNVSEKPNENILTDWEFIGSDLNNNSIFEHAKGIRAYITQL